MCILVRKGNLFIVIFLSKTDYILYMLAYSGLGNLYEEEWIQRYLLSNCNQRMICLKELFQAYHSNQTEIVSEFMLPGTVFFLQLDKQDVYSWNAKTLFEMSNAYNASRKEFVLVHMSDNQKGIHNSTMYTNFYNEFKLVFRNYWWRSDPMLAKLYQEGLLYYFPLGYSSNVIQFKANGALPVSLRNHTISFVGNNKSGNPRRAGNLKELNEKLNFNVTGMVSQHMFGAGSVAQYLQIMRFSKFCLSIRGNFVECYRMYDAFEMGCIVVVIDAYDMWDYTAEHIEQLTQLLSFTWVNSQGATVGPMNTEHLLSKYDKTHISNKKLNLLSTGSGGGCPVKKHRIFSNENCRHINGRNVPFLWFKTVNQAVDFLHAVQNDDMYIQQLYNDQTLWWYQMKRFYQQAFEEKLCIV